jgi:hypothetical protein
MLNVVKLSPSLLTLQHIRLDHVSMESTFQASQIFARQAWKKLGRGQTL